MALVIGLLIPLLGTCYIWEEFKAAGIVMTYPHLNVHLDREEA